jgi:hypothetical protein
MNLNDFINERKINPITQRILNNFVKKVPDLNKKVLIIKNSTNREFCDILTSVFYIKYGYIFEYNYQIKGITSKLFTNKNILIIIGDEVISKIKKDNYMENDFIGIVKEIEKQYIKIMELDRLKFDLSYFPQRVPIDEYLEKNIEDMARESAIEQTFTGTTKVEVLYRIFFEKNSPVVKKFEKEFLNNVNLNKQKFNFIEEI